MSVEMLNVDLVRGEITARGWTLKYVNAQMGLGRRGYELLRGEWLPKNPARKARVLGKLAEMIGLEVPQILMRLEARRAA